MKLIYEGRETLKTKLGTYETMLFTPVMPPNKLFKGEYPVTVWISDDANKIPLKIKAKLVVGALHMDLVEASGIRNK
nr:DUF3108 domain-containing protein [Nitritalea halalkaliphila]